MAASIEQNVQERFHDLAEATRSCSRLVASESAANNWDFPFVTMSSFELYAQQARERARIESLMYLPVVENGSVRPFNDYMRDNENWVETSRTMAQTLDTSSTTSGNVEAIEFPSHMFNTIDGQTVVTMEGTGPYMPVWQWSPPPPTGETNTAPIAKQNFAVMEMESLLMKASQQSKGTCQQPQSGDTKNPTVSTTHSPRPVCP